MAAEGAEESVEGTGDCDRAIFAYGALRGDAPPADGLKAAFRQSGGSWKRAFAPGFRLYEDLDFSYPFACWTGDQNDVVFGTVLEWPSDAAACEAIEMCDRIEGYNPGRPDRGIFRRMAVDVEIPGRCPFAGEHRRVRALIYHQPMPREEVMSRVRAIPGGDIMRGIQTDGLHSNPSPGTVGSRSPDGRKTFSL